MNSDIRQTTELFQVEAELNLLQKDRRKYQNNPLKDYLNINSGSSNTRTKDTSNLPNAQLNLDGYQEY